MTKVIDPTKFKNDGDSSHNMKYCIFHEPNDKVVPYDDKGLEKLNPRWNSNTICFAGLSGLISGYDSKHTDKANRIMYIVQEVKNALPPKKRPRWLKLCVRNKMLPKYILEQDLEGDRFTIDFVDISPSLLYVYLSNLRSMQEDALLIQTVFTLTGTYRMDFAAAFVTASKYTLPNSWHSILDLGKPYGSSGSKINNVDVPLHLAVALRRYLKNPTKYDTRSIYDNRPWSLGSSKHIRKAASRLKEIGYKPQQLLHPLVRKAIRSSSNKKVLEYLENAST
jgi:hypothetical protein